MRYRFEYWFWLVVDWIFPPRCCGCNMLGKRLCQPCLSQIQLIASPVCQKCGTEVSRMGMCKRCHDYPPRITGIRSWAVFGNTIRKAIHQLKYKNNIALGDTFSQHLTEVVLQAEWKIDLITPVPLGIARFKERGYNQASLLARPVAGRLGIPYDPRVVMRTRETKSQTKLNHQERKSNVRGAFKSNHRIVNGKDILIVDDVTTSGSTLESCAESLFDAGANHVYGLTLARVNFYQ